MLMFQPSPMLRRATSEPTWTPPKLSCSLLAQVTVPVWEGGVKTADATVTLEVVVLLILASPPTPRTHTPPPCVSGAAPPGLATKALPCCVRKAVCTFPIDAAIELDAPEVKPPKADTLPILVTNALQFCAIAPEEVATMSSMALPPRSALFLIL